MATGQATSAVSASMPRSSRPQKESSTRISPSCAGSAHASRRSSASPSPAVWRSSRRVSIASKSQFRASCPLAMEKRPWTLPSVSASATGSVSSTGGAAGSASISVSGGFVGPGTTSVRASRRGRRALACAALTSSKRQSSIAMNFFIPIPHFFPFSSIIPASAAPVNMIQYHIVVFRYKNERIQMDALPIPFPAPQRAGVQAAGSSVAAC